MDSWPAAYNNPPIVEALVDVQWRALSDWQAAEARVLDALTAEFPQRQQLNWVELKAELSPRGVATGASSVPWKWLLRSADERQAVGVGPAGVSAHVLKPYPGWQVLRDLAQRVHGTLAKLLLADLEPIGVGLRYIDQITLRAEDGAGLSDYFPLVGRRPPSMESELAALHHVLHTVDPATGQQSILTIATLVPDPEGHPVMLYDLQLRQGLSGGQADWLAVLDALHQRQRHIFEESISAHTRRLFA